MLNGRSVEWPGTPGVLQIFTEGRIQSGKVMAFPNNGSQCDNDVYNDYTEIHVVPNDVDNSAF